MTVSKTAYDDAFRTLLNDCSELIIPVVNEVFGEHYTGKEKIIFGVNEHFLSQDSDNVKKNNHGFQLCYYCFRRCAKKIPHRMSIDS